MHIPLQLRNDTANQPKKKTIRVDAAPLFVCDTCGKQSLSRNEVRVCVWGEGGGILSIIVLRKPFWGVDDRAGLVYCSESP